MNFQRLIQPDCGESNPISQLVQHVTDDQRFQESIGDPHAFGLHQNNLNHPQSFHMNDIMREIEQIDRQKMPIPMPIPPSSSSHIDVQNRFSLGTTWTTEYQNRLQEYPPTKIEQRWDENNLHCHRNETKHFSPNGFGDARWSSPLYGLPESQNFNKNEHRPLSQFEAKIQEYEKSLANFKGGITITSLDELKNLNQLAESSTSSQNIQDEQSELLPETPNCKDDNPILERKPIPEFGNAKNFMRIMNTCLEEFRNNELTPDYQKRNTFTLIDLVNPSEYLHIENNPMRDELQVLEKGDEALANACFSKALLYFDEAIRRNEATPYDWFNLSYALYRNDQDDKAISAIKHYLRLKPKCFRGISLMTNIYSKYDCKYQTCQTVLNWMKNNKRYKHLIPYDFTMNDNYTVDLDKNLLDRVKNLALKAVQENLENVDEHLQLMIGNLYTISKDFDKVADCKLTAIECSNKLSACDLYNMAYSLFYDDKPYKALDIFFEAAKMDNCKMNSYESIGYVYTYLKNFRKAIHYFKKALGPEILSQKSKFPHKGNTLEDEYELCLRLYCEIRNK